MLKILAIYLALCKTYFPAAAAACVAYIAYRRYKRQRCRAAAELREQRREEHEREVEAAGEAVRRERWARSVAGWNKEHSVLDALYAAAKRIDERRVGVNSPLPPQF